MATCRTSGSANAADPAAHISRSRGHRASMQVSLKNSGSASAAETSACRESLSGSSFPSLAKFFNTGTMAGMTCLMGSTSSGSRSSTSCNTSSADAARTSASESERVVDNMPITCSPCAIRPSPKLGTKSFRTSSATTRLPLLPLPMKRDSAGSRLGHSRMRPDTSLAMALATAATTWPALRFTGLTGSCSSVVSSCVITAVFVGAAKSSHTGVRDGVPATSCLRMTAASCRSSAATLLPAARTPARLFVSLSGEPVDASSS
mmetsp:Transcript_81431/g.254167  ORF Transcript_81431/g.254167 Transcript_81431/m.254167 type:complete len:262 (+) Transcript_81431:1345-2130(+)